MTVLLSVHATINDIEPRAWDRLGGGNAFATHAWLRTIETSYRTPAQPRYFTWYQDATLVAASVCYVATPAREVETLDDLLFGRAAPLARTLGLTVLPALVCGPLLGYGWHIGVDPCLTLEAAHQARESVLNAMEEEARRLGVTLTFVHVLAEEQEVMQLLSTAGYLRCRNIPVAVLDIAWRSFDEYLATRSRKRRSEFRRQINRHHDAGNRVERIERTGESDEPLMELLDSNARKHGSHLFACGPGFVTQLIRTMGDGARVFTARRAGRPTAVSVTMAPRQAAYTVAIGVDSAAARDDYSYFHLCYNVPIADAITSGLRRIYYGRGVPDLKVRRGCWLTNTWIYARPSGARRAAVAAWFQLASWWNRRKLSAQARQALVD